MSLSNQAMLFVAGHRSLKRILSPLLPRCSSIPMENGWVLAIDPKDLRGPSFHMARTYRRPMEALQSYEPIQRSLIEESLKSKGEGAVFLDVGANIGLFSFPLARRIPGLRVYAVEPHPRNSHCFRETMRMNGFSQVSLTECAFGEAEGRASLFIDDSDSGGHSTLSENLWNNSGKTQAIAVPSTTIDTFFPAHGIERLDCVKIDVQGAEDAVLRGGQGVLGTFLPDLLIEVQHEKVAEEDSIWKVVEKISPDYRFRTMERAEWSSLENLKAISSERFSKGILFADYFFSVHGNGEAPSGP